MPKLTTELKSAPESAASEPAKKKRPVRKRTPEPVKKKKSRAPGVAAALVVLIIVFVGAIFLLQKSSAEKQRAALEAKIQELQNTAADLGNAQTQLGQDKESLQQQIQETEDALAAARLQLEEQNIRSTRKINSSLVIRTLCTDKPTTTESGRLAYPMHPKYFNLTLLGELFTADDCGAKRFNAIYASKDAQYALASTIELFSDKNPDEKLRNVFGSVGYSCAEEGAADAACQTWKIEKTVAIGSLLSLKPHFEIFKSDQCVGCGPVATTTVSSTASASETATPLPTE